MPAITVPSLETALRIARFGIVGGLATLTHLGCAYLFSTFTALPLLVVNILAFCVAFILSFCGHYYWTFRTGAPKLRALTRFFTVALSGLCASSLLLSLLIAWDLGGDFTKLTISILIIPAITYLAGQLWAFRADKKETQI